MFDEMDGKQARKTGNSSPLGMLFDHGCDAFSVGFVMIASAKLVGVGNTLSTLIWISAAITIFHFCTLEEYYTGTLILGPGNCVSDFCFPIVAVYIACGLFSCKWIQIEVIEQNQLW